MKYYILLLFSFTTLFSQNKIALKTGDIIFQKMNCGELCDAIHAVTDGYKNNDFSHLGLVYIKNDTTYIIEAAGNNVRMVLLEDFSKNTKTNMFVGRLKKKHQKLIPQAIDFCLTQIGVAYDDEYLYNNDKYYCSELIYDAFLDAYKKPFFSLTPMTFKEPNSNTFFKVWVDYYSTLNTKIPEGELGCNPGGISKSNKLRIIGTL